MKKYVAIAPEGEYLNITSGKEYPIIEFLSNSKNYGILFTILDDVGFYLVCPEIECAHLQGGNWTIKEVE